MVEFKLGDVIHDLAISPSGRFLAATLHRVDGRQAIIIADVATLKSQGKFIYKSISTDGSPEFPSWSLDERYLYWSAYTNGVSNIYRYDAEITETVAMSHGSGFKVRVVFEVSILKSTPRKRTAIINFLQPDDQRRALYAPLASGGDCGFHGNLAERRLRQSSRQF